MQRQFLDRTCLGASFKHHVRQLEGTPRPNGSKSTPHYRQRLPPLHCVKSSVQGTQLSDARRLIIPVKPCIFSEYGNMFDYACGNISDSVFVNVSDFTHNANMSDYLFNDPYQQLQQVQGLRPQRWRVPGTHPQL